MRIIGQPSGQEAQLDLVQETLRELTFRLGDNPTLVKKKAWESFFLSLAFSIGAIVFLAISHE